MTGDEWLSLTGMLADMGLQILEVNVKRQTILVHVPPVDGD